MDKEERYINLSDRQVKDTQNQSQDFLSIKTICRILNKQDQTITDLDSKLAEMQCKLYVLYSMLYKTLENQDYENIASQIDQMTDYTFEKEADWFKGNRNYDQLKQQLVEKDAEVQSWKDGTMVVKLGKLEEQLAEKEKQLTFVKEELAKEEKGHLKQMMDFEKRCQRFYGSNERVIDVLDEVRSLADRLLENFMLSKEYQDRKFRGRKLIEYYPFVNAIDKLIKSLKGEK